MAERRVRFDPEVKVHIMTVYALAAREARKDCWMIYARDRDRFQRRIQEYKKTMDKILDVSHRLMIYNNRFK